MPIWPGLSREDLLKQWGIDLKQFDPQVRQRLIFRNDADTYKRAKAASDGFEHGYLPFPEIHAEALATNRQTAAYLRQTILEQLNLPPEQLNALLANPYDQPFYLDYSKNIRGALEGGEDQLAASDQDYPILRWRSSAQELPTRPGEDPRIRFVETFEPNLSDAIRFVPERIEVWGPESSGTPSSDEIVVPQVDHPAQRRAQPGVGGVEWNRPDLKPFAAGMTTFLLNFGAIDLLSRQWLDALTDGSRAGDELTFVDRVDTLLESLRAVTLSEDLRAECEELWPSTKSLAAMQDSISRSPLLFGWHGAEEDRPPDFAMMLRRTNPHWPQGPEATIVLEELARATDEAAATAAKLVSLGDRMDVQLASGNVGEDEA